MQTGSPKLFHLTYIFIFILIPIPWSPWWLTVASLAVCAALAWLLSSQVIGKVATSTSQNLNSVTNRLSPVPDPSVPEIL
jgi:membrane protein implicated in regulation of membrane protease activity